MNREWRVANRDHPLFATRPLPRIPQSSRNSVDRDLDAAQHLLVRVLRTMLAEQFHLHMVERLAIGKAVADGAFEQRIALQQTILSHDVKQRLDRGMAFAPNAAEDLLAQGGIRHQ